VTNFVINLPVRILWNGTDITGTTTNTVIVGQQVNLQAVLDPSLPTPSNFTWNVGGSVISNYVVAAGSSSAQVLSLTQTNSASVNFYWVSGGQQMATCTVVLANGTPIPVYAGFNVKRPSSSLNVVGVGTITCDANYYIQGVKVTAPWFHFGDGAGNPGVLFTNVADLSVPGSNQWVQVASVSQSETTNSGIVWSYIAAGVDGFFPYQSVRAPQAVADSPGLGNPDDPTGLNNYYTTATVGDFYDMWLMFMPTNTANSVWVPLKKVHWGWGGTIARTGTVWSVTSGTASITTPVVSDTPNATNYPTWTQKAQDGEWVPH